MNYYNPTKQNKFGKEGNCLSAVIATLFDIELSSIPIFADDEEFWIVELSRWVCKRFGKYVTPIKLATPEDIFIFCGSLMITTINSNNTDVNRHTVITIGDKIIFDPMEGEVDQLLSKEMDPTFMVIGDVRTIENNKINKL